MPRTLTAVDLIDLPALSAAEAHTLAQALENAALDDKAKLVKLPEAIKETYDAMIVARVALLAVLHDTPADEAKVKPVDIRIDRIISAMFRIIRAWARLVDELAEGEAAVALLGRLFPDGIAFISIAPRAEWSEIEARLEVIKREQLEPQLESLGLGPLVGLLRVVHVEYGKVTGATATIVAPESAQTNTRKLALQDAIREHVAAVIGAVRKSRPETQALADKLLGPLAEWESRPVKRGAGKAGGATDSAAGKDKAGGGGDPK